MKRLLNAIFVCLFFIACDHIPMSPDEPVSTTGDDDDVTAKVVSPVTSWGHNYGADGDEHAKAVIKTTDGGFALCGNVDGDFYLVKTDKNGHLLWENKYGTATVSESGNDLCQTSDGGYLMVGIDEGVWKAKAVKVNSVGGVQWEKTYPNLDAYNVSIARSSDGGFMGLLHSSVFKLDCNGTLLWTKDYGAIGLNMGRSIESTSDNGFIIAGMSILKIAADGTVQWKKDDSYGNYTHAIQTDDKGYVFTGYRSVRYDEDYMEIVTEVVLTKVDSKGNFEWRKGYFPSVYNFFDYKAQQLKDHSYAMVGFMNYKPSLIKVSSTGKYQWRKSIDGAFLSGEYTDLLISSDEGFILVGDVFMNHNGTWNTQAALVKTDRQGNVK